MADDRVTQIASLMLADLDEDMVRVQRRLTLGEAEDLRRGVDDALDRIRHDAAMASLGVESL